MTEKPFAVNELLVMHGSLFRVVELTEHGFRVHCENGCWYGEFNIAEASLTLDGDDDEGKHLSVTIMSRAQPPANLSHYNEIIPWMLENKDAA